MCVENDIPLTAGDASFHLLLRTPERLAARPAALISLAMDRRTSLAVQPYCRIVDAFLAAGHYAASLDLPNHGERVNAYGDGLGGWAAAAAAGVDPFAELVASGKAAVDACIARLPGLAGIVAAGTSRGGFCAIRLTAADARIGAVAGLAPVTWLPALSEFDGLAGNAIVQGANLDSFIVPLTGRPVFLGIGIDDRRVGTAHCLRLHTSLRNAAPGACLPFVLTPDVTHCAPDYLYDEAARFLLRRVRAGLPAIN